MYITIAICNAHARKRLIAADCNYLRDYTGTDLWSGESRKNNTYTGQVVPVDPEHSVKRTFGRIATDRTYAITCVKVHIVKKVQTERR